MSDAPGLSQAKSTADVARARFLSTLGEVRERLKPANLARDTAETAAHALATAARRGADAARARPFLAAAVAGAVGAFLARGRIVGMLRRRDETAPAVKG